MHAGVKLFIGLILVLAGLWLLVPAGLLSKPSVVAGIPVDWLGDFVTVLKGAIPPVLILMGALIVWIEWEELKMPSLEEEEPEEKSKKEKKSKK